MKNKLHLLAIAAVLTFSGHAKAESVDEGETIKVQNGVTVKAAPKKEDDIKYEYPGAPKPIFDAREKPAAETEKKEEVKPEVPKEVKAEPKKEETFRMQPIIPKTSTAKPVAPKTETKKPDDAAKTVESAPSPFKKSQDATAKETVKKPEPKAEVVAKPLPAPESAKDQPKENMSDEISNIDKLKPDNKEDDKKKDDAEPTLGESGLPIPRFVSLKSGEINARTGPGETYPIRWVYQRKNLPVEITAEFKLWRRIKDFDGEQSWTHQAMLSSRRYAILQHDATAQSESDGSGSPVARFKRGVQVKVNECKPDMCQVEYGKLEGWIKKKDLWGIYPSDVFN